MDILAASRVLFATILIASSTMLSAQTVYSWNDEQGVVTYGHNPPPGVNASIVSDSSQAYQPEPGEATPYSISDSIKDKGEQKPEQEKQYSTKEGLKMLCQGARKNLATITRSGMIRIKDTDGNFRVLTDEEKQQRKEKNQKIIDENC
ncbi:MAG: hypothetical protein ACJAQS_000275 [Porticoccus sp.]|jgi:hypothetical protein